MKKIAFIAIAVLFCAATADAQIITGSTYSSSSESTSTVEGAHYQGEFNIGYGLAGKEKSDGEKYDSHYSRVFFETVHGVRIMPYLFAGVGVGFQYAYESEAEIGVIPAFLDIKGYYPVTDNFAPYVAVDLGYGIGVLGTELDSDTKLKGGLYASYGLGLNFRKLNFGFGWQSQSFSYDRDGEKGDKFSVSSFFVKVGLKF